MLPLEHACFCHKWTFPASFPGNIEGQSAETSWNSQKAYIAVCMPAGPNYLCLCGTICNMPACLQVLGRSSIAHTNLEVLGDTDNYWNESHICELCISLDQFARNDYKYNYAVLTSSPSIPCSRFACMSYQAEPQTQQSASHYYSFKSKSSSKFFNI